MEVDLKALAFFFSGSGAACSSRIRNWMFPESTVQHVAEAGCEKLLVEDIFQRTTKARRKCTYFE